jgi:hypothetical protein
MRDRFDLDLDRRIGQCRHLHQGRGREIAGEELAAGCQTFSRWLMSVTKIVTLTMSAIEPPAASTR